MDCSFLNEIAVLPRQLVLAGVSDAVGLGQLRSVWGMTLARLAPGAFGCVFEGKQDENKNQRPAYALSDLGAQADGLRLIRWTLIGRGALEHDAALCAAWEAAGRVGVGGGRVPFQVTAARLLGPAGEIAEAGGADAAGAWRLGDAQWPLPGDPARTPCRLTFPGGLQLRFKQAGKTARFEDPSWPAIIDAACRRLAAWLPEELHDDLAAAQAGWLDDAARLPMTVSTRPATTSGWSRRQQLRTGEGRKQYLAHVGPISLPGGPGAGWPLLLAASRLAIGHHTTEGMGWFRIDPLG